MTTLTREQSSNPWLAPPGNDLADDFGTIGIPTVEQVHHARLVVCGMADDAGEAAMFLAMLGIENPQSHKGSEHISAIESGAISGPASAQTDRGQTDLLGARSAH